MGDLEKVLPAEGEPRIKEVRAFVVRGRGSSSDVHAVGDSHWIMGAGPRHAPIANPMSKFPQYRGSRASWGVAAVATVVVEIEQDDGVVGVGCSCGGEAACFIIEEHLARFVEGQSVKNIGYIWDQCWRASIHYSRKGLGVHAISAIDVALWDLLGKVKGEPVYNLLGGKTCARVPCYATTARPDHAKRMGFRGAKVPLPHGPADGPRGLRKNVEFVAKWRAACGPDFSLAVDCYMALDVAYAAALAKKLEPYDVLWLEEALLPDEYDAHADLSRKLEGMGSTILHAAGEHEHTRWGFAKLMDAGVGLVQPDVMWCGGPSEFAKIAALASARGVQIIPHGCGVYGYHMAMAFPNVPCAEYLVMSEDADGPAPAFGDLFVDEPTPKDGYVTLDATKPGFGMVLNRDKVQLDRPYDRRAKADILRTYKKVTEDANKPLPPTKKRSDSTSVRDADVVAADRALADSLFE